MTGAGLLWYGQNYLIYPSAFPPGSRIGSRVWWCLKPLILIAVNYPDVPVPSDFGMPYQDLELRTPDDILLRCYLLPQRKTLHADHSEAVRVPYDGSETDDEVNFFVLLRDASDGYSYIVYCQPANCRHVPWKWGESWPPNPTCQNIFHEDAM